MPRAKRAIGYARVSSAEQALGSSLKDQQAAITAYAKGRGLAVAKFYVEAESAIHEKLERRLQMQALLADVRPGDLVLCDKLDRWSRDPEFTYSSVRRILEAGAAFYAVGDQCDPSTPEGDTLLNFRVLFAREEHKRIKLRMVGTRKILRDQGYYVEGLPPIGYRRSKPRGERGADKNVLVVERDEAELVRRAFRMCVAGKSINEIADRVGLKRDRIADVLHNRVYLGEIRNSAGRWIRGKHPAIVDADLFTRAKDALAGRFRVGGRSVDGTGAETDTWILRDVARCARCGGKMGAAYAGPRGPGRRYYYRCIKRCMSHGDRSNTRSHVPVGPVEKLFAAMVVDRLVALRGEIARGSDGDVEREDVGPRIAEQRAELHRRRERALDAYVEGHMTKEKLGTMVAKIDAASLKLDAEEQAAKKRTPLEDAAFRREVLREVDAMRSAWRRADAQTRRKIVNILASSVGLKNGADPRPVWRSAEEMAGVRA